MDAAKGSSGQVPVPVGLSEKMHITAGDNKRVTQNICTNSRKREWTREARVY